MIIRKFLITYIILLSFLPACTGSQHSHSDITQTVVSNKGIVTPTVLELLKLTGIQHNGSLEDIVEKTQQAWIRKPGTERWDIENKIPENYDDIIKVLQNLSLCSKINPQKNSYQYCIVLGALLDTMIKRMDFATDLWNHGIRFNHIVLLSSARPTNTAQKETKESIEKLAGHNITEPVQTEADMIKLVYQYTPMPDAMRKLPVTIIDVAMLTTQDGQTKRPTTADTVEYWLATKPKPGTVLAISSQPYVTYQQSVLQTLLPKDFAVETVGCSYPDPIKIGVMLDTVARILYQEKQRLTSHQN